jgi:hypothetical protein
MSFDIWDETGNCPHCGSGDTEVYLDEEIYHCCECGRFSASYLSDGLEIETEMINNFDRFDLHDLFHSDFVGGE